ncbi:alpha/beta-hydrolase [Peniophora sp. CONT]|nr:alpha/beta-hydrolase [Peniophora sp. CONT]
MSSGTVKSASKGRDASLLPAPSLAPVNHATSARRRGWRTVGAFGLVLLFGLAQYYATRGAARHSHISSLETQHSIYEPSSFYHSVSRAESICPGVVPGTPSHAGYIGLSDDSDEAPQRSFFWYFEAEEDAENAPVILTIGGGPGTSGLANPVLGLSHCVLTKNGTVPNPNRWTEKFNLLALDYPVGVGYSYGPIVNNSRDAAYEAYDFLQKFFVLFPHLAKNQFVISSGSYGGIWVPHIATVIQEQNKAIARGEGIPGAIPINLESLALSNPASSPKAWFGWMLYYMCELHDVYNATTCASLYPLLPQCLDKLDYALDEATSTAESRNDALEFCSGLFDGDVHGAVLQDIRKTCKEGDMGICYPEFLWMNDFFRSNKTTEVLGVPQDVEWSSVNTDVFLRFVGYGDHIFNHFRLYEPLLTDGIRILHNVGMQDASVAWPGTFSFLKLLQSPFSAEFRGAADVPWPSAEAPAGTVRVSGSGGAGNFTFLTYAEAGHFVSLDQPTLTKYVIERWVENKPFV